MQRSTGRWGAMGALVLLAPLGLAGCVPGAAMSAAGGAGPAAGIRSLGAAPMQLAAAGGGGRPSELPGLAGSGELTGPVAGNLDGALRSTVSTGGTPGSQPPARAPGTNTDLGSSVATDSAAAAPPTPAPTPEHTSLFYRSIMSLPPSENVEDRRGEVYDPNRPLDPLPPPGEDLSNTDLARSLGIDHIGRLGQTAPPVEGTPATTTDGGP